MKANAPEKIWVHELSAMELNVPLKEYHVEYFRTDAFMKKAKKAFCKAMCQGHPPRSTCTSLGTCKKYDNFIKYMKGE